MVIGAWAVVSYQFRCCVLFWISWRILASSSAIKHRMQCNFLSVFALQYS